ncbi:MAG: hypothetical protein KGY65_00935 [Candidatus Thermoplasmatota archaeon]|nr:hypothetical protein [Candidatus Thermoplasmatota archaeon]MBS3801294.1 hypothetical protein [Candidatus Thermoplasmatota archaeon]
MGRKKDKTNEYNQLSPEELHTHIRKNISIPKYMDAFLYEQNISLSKLVQNAIITRMEEEKETIIKKDVHKEIQDKKARKRLQEERKKNPEFENELKRAKHVLTAYFNAFDDNDTDALHRRKQLMLKEFPEMYVDVLKFEEWYEKNQLRYQRMKNHYDNPIERLIRIKNMFASTTPP